MKMGKNLTVLFSMGKSMEEDFLLKTALVSLMKENSLMIKDMAKEPSVIKIAIMSMKEIGRTVSNMVEDS